ncbi:MAG: ABC transporter permease [Bradyrhizobiaceae bacterium]|nr:ABC transporter permease [Bradyrhizobiaceae bacterium]
MLDFLVRRLGQVILTLFLISIVAFFMLRLMPGDPAQVLAGQDASQELVAEIRTRLGLDQPVAVQYLKYLESLATGDLGYSIRSRQPVLEEVAARLPATLALGYSAILIALALGLLLGVWAAVRVGRWPDILVLMAALLGVSAPTFWIGLLLILLFSVHLGWLPVAATGRWDSFILPIATLVPLSLAIFSRLARSTMLDVLSEDYIRTAVAKGVKERVVLWRHALRNALIPVVTIAGLEFARLLGGVIAVETIFAWPGAGKALVDAIVSRDFPMIQGLILAFALVFALTNLLVDILNGIIDPRVRKA